MFKLMYITKYAIDFGTAWCMQICTTGRGFPIPMHLIFHLIYKFCISHSFIFSLTRERYIVKYVYTFGFCYGLSNMRLYNLKSLKA